MDKAVERPLGEVAEIIMGQSPASESYNEKGEGIPFYQGKSDFGEVHPTVRMYCNSPQKTAAENDILMSVRAPVGDVNIARETCCIGRGLAAIRSKEAVHFKYLFYLLDYCKERLAVQGTGTTFKAIGKDVLTGFPIPVWDRSVQQAIVSMLDELYRMISNRNQAIYILDELVKSRFVEMFGDPIINHHGWKKDFLRNHADVIVGYPFPSSEYVANGIPIVGGYNLMQGFVQWENSKYWQSAEGHEQYLLKDNDIVIAMDRPWVGSGFKIAPINKDNLPAILIQRTACIRSNDVSPAFLYMLLDSIWFANHCQITGSVVPHISNKDILSYEIIVPPIALQNQFADFVALTDRSKSAVQQSVDTLQTLKDKLMQEYFG